MSPPLSDKDMDAIRDQLAVVMDGRRRGMSLVYGRDAIADLASLLVEVDRSRVPPRTIHDLYPCPFCDGPPQYAEGIHGTELQVYVYCCHCPARTEVVGSREAARKVWNKRSERGRNTPGDERARWEEPRTVAGQKQGRLLGPAGVLWSYAGTGPVWVVHRQGVKCFTGSSEEEVRAYIQMTANQHGWEVYG